MGLARQNRTLLFTAILLFATFPAEGAETQANDQKTAACATPGVWIDPASYAILGQRRLLADLATRPVVLLGERHDSAEHHRWQLHTLSALHGRQPKMVIGFEAFPRQVQPVLDRWVAGDLTPEAFLETVEWSTIWGFDAELYLPLFHFARQNRLPMLALNVNRGLVARVGREGFAAVLPEDREGVSIPAPPPPAYRQSLARVFAHKKQISADAFETQTDPAFGRFVEAQLTWDRAMAEAIADTKKVNDKRLLVAIMGQGHLENRWGVPHQLADLGISDAAVLLPVSVSEDCAGVSPGIADAVFTVHPDNEPLPRGPRLGVMIESVDGGARVTKVISGSVAEATGIETGDVIVKAAGLPVAGSDDLIATVKRQAPGTWLPLQIRRSGTTIDRVARFPPHTEPPG